MPGFQRGKAGGQKETEEKIAKKKKNIKGLIVSILLVILASVGAVYIKANY